jgi:alkaline phosphatase D
MKRDIARQLPACVTAFAAILVSAADASGTEFRSAWPGDVRRNWVGPEFWANRLQDWRIADGRLECVETRAAKPVRTVHLLTRRLGRQPGELSMSVRTGLLSSTPRVTPDAAAGFLIGAGSELDYRAAALVHHSPGPGGGIIAAVDATGRAVFRDMSAPAVPLLAGADTLPDALPSEVELRLTARPAGETYELMLTVHDAATATPISSATLRDVAPNRLIGSLALLSHPGSRPDKDNEHEADTQTGAFWFRNWTVAGSKIEEQDDRTCGPVLSTIYTLSRGTLKMTAQMMPLGPTDTRTVTLEVQRDGRWQQAAVADIIEPGYTATFRVESWDARRDMPYRVLYDLKQDDSSTTTYVWAGTVRHDPIDKREIVVAAFTGNHNVRPGGVDGGSFDWTPQACWFPHNDLIAHVAAHEPDVLFFSGDQVYEGASPTHAEIEPLDYMYKWYLWCWAFRNLARDRPCICIPDDHDVYQGNLWGAGGRKARRPDDGGYTRPVEFVNMVERTQTSHLPDPYDPTPVAQGIGVYYCALNYGRISFAILEDRKFKSSATALVPEGKVVNGWFQNPDFDPATQADVPGATLLGERQLRFLHDWSTDWSYGAALKVALSQTLFSNVATLPKRSTGDGVLPSMKRLRPDQYPTDERLAADADSNGWPQTGRNKALREFRRCFALHIAGDQHLGSTIQYGVDEWRDAGFALCVPSIANFWPRRWYPPTPGLNRDPGAPRYTGDYRDGFGNYMTVYAVSNPVISGHEPAALHDRAPGYGIVKLDNDRREITIECWPRWEDPSQPGAQQYAGWPITVAQADNYGRRAAAYLPMVEVRGLIDPVIQVIEEATGEVVYALRIKGTAFRPWVFKQGLYTITVGEPDTGQTRALTHLESTAGGEPQPVSVEFRTGRAP